MMVKTKRKHLAALDVQKRQKLPAEEAPISSPSSIKQESPEQLALPSSTSLAFKDQEHLSTLDGRKDPTAEISCTSQSSPEAGHQAQGNTQPPCLREHDDTDSDCNSWVEVRKQRVVIIIPPLPQPKRKPLITKLAHSRKNNSQCTPRKSRAGDKGPSSNVYGKKTWKNAIRTLETESKGAGRRMREKINRDAPPISSMDILLASALGTDHTSWPEKGHHHIDLLASCTQEEASLDTADSSIQPKSFLSKISKPVMRNKGATKLHCKPAHSNKARKLVRTQHATCLTNDPRRPHHANTKEQQGINASPVLSSSQAIRIVTLKKHLEKAGGLKHWLCSLGLGQFKEVFAKRMWSERDLLQLQMDDLKQLGKPAVGPRRKLIWAIHHLSQQTI